MPQYLRTLDHLTLPAFYALPILMVIQAAFLFKWRAWRSFLLSAVLLVAAWTATCFVIISALSALR